MQRVAVDQDQVGPAARFDHSAVGQPEVAGGPGGSRAQRVHRGQPGVDQELELVVQAGPVRDGGRASDAVGARVVAPVSWASVPARIGTPARYMTVTLARAAP